MCPTDKQIFHVVPPVQRSIADGATTKNNVCFTFIQIGSNPPELDEVMLLELQGETDVVKVVEGIDGRLETVVILFLKWMKG